MRYSAALGIPAATVAVAAAARPHPPHAGSPAARTAPQGQAPRLQQPATTGAT
jgi:hypothetical protein